MHDNNDTGPRTQRIMVVDDDRYLLMAIEQTLQLNGYTVDTFASPVEALEQLGREEYAAVVTDIKMPVMDGLQFLTHVKAADRELPVIMITGHGDIALAVTAIQGGAYDFLQKPVDEDVLLACLVRAMEKRQLVLENRRLSYSLAEQRQDLTRFYGLIGNHPAMHRLYDIIKAVAAESDPVMIYGETGTGKELVARAIHEIGSRAGQPFVAVNMGAIPSEMMESELFGHLKGAFTGAHQRKVGKFEFAGEGTLFLDEICSLPIALQSKLLRVLEEKAITPLGSNTQVPVKARIIAATNKDLEQEIARENFRQDLYFRLSVLPVRIQPLRERREDIPLLVEFFRQEYGYGKMQAPPPFPPETIREICAAPWPGNVRELRNHVRRLCILGSIEHGVSECQKKKGEVSGTPEQLPLKGYMDRMEKSYIEAALRKNSGQVAPTCSQLGISRKSLYDKVGRHAIDLSAFRAGGE
ncbi:MAG: sigma-54-dependent Fis family transcriptional regulator [Desulfobulbaceae bacterium]|nr:MAG: sigma-54-dependent Fis family transcriptional regulator [Desulfobulbaceae bacterium]